MAASKDDESFWNSNLTLTSFDFDNIENDNLFGVSVEHAENVKAGISDIGTFESFSNSADRQKNLIPLLSIISDKSLLKILESDKLQYIKDDSSAVSPNVVLDQILLGQTYSLENFKSLNSKINLLDASLKNGNGNAILGIILFIKKTLKRSLFQKLIIERPTALYIYIHYLSKKMCSNEICDILTMFGKTSEAAIRCFDIIIQNAEKIENNIEPYYSKISKNYSMMFSNLADCRETSFVRAYIKLLDWQKNSQDKFSEPVKYNCSVLECLKLACKDYWGFPESNMYSPLSLVTNQEILPQHYQKIAILTRASVQAWNDIDSLLHKKGWLGGKKLQTNIPIRDVLKILQNNQAPQDIVEKFLNYVENTKRLQLAKSLNCHRAVINILASQGDRSALLEYKSHLRGQTEEYFFAESVLCSNKIKWKN